MFATCMSHAGIPFLRSRLSTNLSGKTTTTGITPVPDLYRSPGESEFICIGSPSLCKSLADCLTNAPWSGYTGRIDYGNLIMKWTSIMLGITHFRLNDGMTIPNYIIIIHT